MLRLNTRSGPHLFAPEQIVEIAPAASGCSIRLSAARGWTPVSETADEVAMLKMLWACRATHAPSGTLSISVGLGHLRQPAWKAPRVDLTAGGATLWGLI